MRDLRNAVRSLARSPAFTLTALLSLGLALGAGAAAFSVIDAVRFRALPFPAADRLVVIAEVPTAAAGNTAAGCANAATCKVAYETFAQVLRDYPFRTLDRIAAFTSGGKSLNLGGDPVIMVGGVVSPGLFDMLEAKPVLGRDFTAEDNRVGAPLVTVLTHALWTSAFARDPEIIGRVIKLSDSQYTVIGVMPPGFRFETNSDFWLPDVPTLDPSTRPSIRAITVLGRLAPGATLEQLESELSGIAPATTPEEPLAVTRLAAASMRERYTTSTRSHDLIFAAIVLCVLLIACANLANLALVRTLHQRRDLAIRSALGAGSGRLMRQLFAEHLLLVVASAALGLLFASRLLAVLDALPALQSIRPDGMRYRVDGRVLAFATLLTVVVAAVLSLLPARIIASTDAQRLLRAGGAGGGGFGSRAQSGFVIAQIASAVVLLIGGGLMAKTVMRLARIDPGFDSAHVLQGTPSLPHDWRVEVTYTPLFDRIIGDVRALPGAASVALRASVPLSPRGGAADVVPAGMSEPLAATLVPRTALSITADYFATMGVDMASGRAFDARDRKESLPVAIVNEWVARRWWQGADPVGETIRVSGNGAKVTLTIVGVVRDNRAARPGVVLADDGPEVYRPWEQAPSAFPTFLVRSRGEPASLVRPLREVLVRGVPDRPLSTSMLSADIAAQLDGVRTNALQIVGFAVVGLFLALIGIYGVLSYSAGQRTREIAIRGALGATRVRIQSMVLREAAILTAFGLVIGLPIASAATRVIASTLYGTDPADRAVYATVAAGTVVVSLLASWLPARRAAKVEPSVALRG